MALANYIDKISLGAAQILQGYNQTLFEKLLLNQKLLIYFDKAAALSSEGRATLDMLVRLLARLYPAINIDGQESNDLACNLKKLARSINSQIELSEIGQPTLVVVIGNSHYPNQNVVPTFYLGSDNWNAKFSTHEPQSSGNSGNPIAAGAIACIGAANIFRTVFKDHLSRGEVDKDFILSLLDYNLSPESSGPIIPPTKMNELCLVGVGAVGNGAVWTFRLLKQVKGSLVLVDNECVALSNLQRYVLATEIDFQRKKTDVACSYLKGASVKPQPQQCSWSEYVQKRNSYLLDSIAVCVDNANDRILVQGSLPKKLFNAWTQQENIGVSRHLNFISDPCLACLYWPTQERKSISQEIAESIRLQEPVVRDYLANNKPIDEALLSLISAANSLEATSLRQFLGKSLQVFYGEAVCGGILMRLTGNAINEKSQNSEVPCAFESALAGILLASETIIDIAGLRTKKLPTSSRFNLLRPLTSYLNFEEAKRVNCICQDSVFTKAFSNKWLSSVT